MKKYILLTLLFLLPLSIQANEFKIDERKSDIYFANSILTDKDTAIASLILIRKNIKLEQYEDHDIKMEKELNFDTAYNHTYGFTNDIEETIMQLSDESLNWETFSQTISFLITRSAGKIVKSVVGSKKANELSKRVFETTNISLSSIIISRRNIDLITQIQKYKYSIRQGHGVIVIGHGQGDLFAYEASKKILKADSFKGVEYRDNGWLEEYFSWISVGTPSNYRPSSHPQVAFDNDIITTFNKREKETNPNRFQFINGVNETVDEHIIDFHQFKYYMGAPIHIKDGVKDKNVSTDLAKKDIMVFLKNAIKKHRTAQSQWAVDEEFDENTKDYKISVKHIEENQLTHYMKDIKIYPFSGAKKLYQLDSDEWVKASFGGEKILESWENQKDNQFYFLQGTDPAEYIEGEAQDAPCTNLPYKADHFIVDWDFAIEEGNREYVYYANNPQEMGARLMFRISSLDSDGYMFTELDNSCYSGDVNVTLTFDAKGVKNLNSNIQYKDTDTSLKPFDTLKESGNTYSFMIKKSDFINGAATKEIKINFDRAKNIAVSPMMLTITDINASLGDINGNDSTDKSVTFVYARANGVDQGSRGSLLNAKIYYEVYSGSDSNRRDFNINGRESHNSVHWYMIDGDNNLNYSSPRAKYGSLNARKLNNNLIELSLNRNPPVVNRIYFTPKEYLLYRSYNANVKNHSFRVTFY